MILFIGSREKGFFAEEVTECSFVEEFPHIEHQINQILEIKTCTHLVFDIGQYIDDAETLATEIMKICKVNGSKPVIFAPGYLVKSQVIMKLYEKGMRNFIFSIHLSEQKEQLRKCMNGYYESNEIEELQDLAEEGTGEEQKLEWSCKFIGIAGACSRIGTTTQCIQIAKYLMLKGYKVCYIEMNESHYVESLEWYTVEKDEEIGKITYQYVDHFYKKENIAEVLKLGYDYYIYDFGVFTDKDFNKISFLEKNIRIFVVGAFPTEMPSTYSVIENSYYEQVFYLYNLTAETEREDIIELMQDKADRTFFSGYTPDPYVLGDPRVYEELIPVTIKESTAEKKKGWMWRLKKEHVS